MQETKYLFPKRFQKKNSKEKHNINTFSTKCLINNNTRSNLFPSKDFHLSSQVNNHKNISEAMLRIHSEKSITSPNNKSSNFSPHNPMASGIVSPKYNQLQIKNKNGQASMCGFYKPTNSNNIPRNSRQNVLYSQRLEITGNISLLDNPQARLSKYNSLIALQTANIKKSTFKPMNSYLQKQTKQQLSQIKSQQSLQKYVAKPKPTTKFLPIFSPNIQQKRYQPSKYNLTSTIPLKSKNRSKTIINKQKKNYQKESKVKGQDSEFMSQLKISDIQCIGVEDREQQIVTTQTKRVSQNSTSRNDIYETVFPYNHRSKQNKNFSKEKYYIRQSSNKRRSCNTQFRDLLQQKKSLKQKLSSLEIKFVEKEQKVKQLEKQLERYKKNRKQYKIDQSNLKQFENNQTKQHQIEKKCLRQQILLLKMANKKLEMHYDVHDKQIEDLKKKLQEKQRIELQISRQYHNQQYFKKHATDSIHLFEEENKSSSVIIKNDLSNDFDPLEGLNFQLYDMKNQNEHLSELLRKAEDQIQRLRAHNRKLRQQNDRYLSIKKNQNQPADKFSCSSKIINNSLKQDDKIVQYYKEVLKLFGVVLNTNQLAECHLQLMSQIDFFKKSLMDLLEKLRKSEDHKLMISQELEKVKKIKLQQTKSQNNVNSEQRLDFNEARHILKKQDLQKLISSLNQRIKNLQPQLDNKFNDLIKRLYKIIKILRQKFGHQVEDIFVKLIREDEILAYYARF